MRLHHQIAHQALAEDDDGVGRLGPAGDGPGHRAAGDPKERHPVPGHVGGDAQESRPVVDVGRDVRGVGRGDERPLARRVPGSAGGRANVHDRPGHGVAHHAGIDRSLEAVAPEDLRAAGDEAGVRPHQHLAGGDGGNRDLLQEDVPVPVALGQALHRRPRSSARDPCPSHGSIRIRILQAPAGEGNGEIRRPARVLHSGWRISPSAHRIVRPDRSPPRLGHDTRRGPDRWSPLTGCGQGGACRPCRPYRLSAGGAKSALSIRRCQRTVGC
jgi:hypothetical protein